LVEKAILVAVASDGSTSVQASLDELTELAKSARVSVVGQFVQKLSHPSRTHFLGKGKLEELVALREEIPYDTVIFDDELTPMQQQNLEEDLKVKVLDRPAVILDIFAQRARTREGILQVELAQMKYLLPRLAGQWSHLERLGGGIGTRGPGESQLETDKRLTRKKIAVLEDRIEQVRKQRSLYRQHRQKTGIPVVALVGYTNAGKSTLLNTISKETVVLARNEMFSTLDPTTRRITMPNGKPVLFTDTVGFIRKLPPTLVAAFRATLEELSDADLLLHIVDFSSPDAPGQCQTVEEILGELNIADKPRITVLNKVDKALPSDRQWAEKSAMEYLPQQGCEEDENTAVISAVKGWGVQRLQSMVVDKLTSTGAFDRITYDYIEPQQPEI